MTTLHALLILHPQAQASAAGGPSNDGAGGNHTLLDGNIINSSTNGSSPGRLNSLFKGGLFKGAATISLSSTDDDRVAADDAAGQVLMPKHWEEQIKTAPLGRRRVMRRWGQHRTQWTVTCVTLCNGKTVGASSAAVWQRPRQYCMHRAANTA